MTPSINARSAGSALKILVVCAIALFTAWQAPTLRGDDPPGADFVGAVDGEAISVQGPMSVEAVHGQVKTILRSGSDVRVKAGLARIDLVEGGNITICGPAHFSVLKSGGALTVALDSGTIHVHIESQPAVTVYTPQIQARPLAIGGGPQDVLIGLDASGAMCIRADKGAVRIEQQLTGQSVLVPQSGDVSLTNGQMESLRTSTGRCVCEVAPNAKSSMPVTDVSVLASAEESKKMAEKKAAPPPAEAPARKQKEEPVYQVFMPPLQYDASAKVQRDYDPSLVILVRRVRVRPTLIFQGKVEGDAIVAQVAKPAPAADPKPGSSATKPEEATTWNRVRTFFRRLWSPSS